MYDDGTLDPGREEAREERAIDAWLGWQRRLVYEPMLVREHWADPHGVLRARDPRDVAAPEPGACFAGERTRLAKLGAVLVPIVAEACPDALRELPDPPVLLHVRGDVSLLKRPAVAFVGARAATHYGKVQARRFAREVARAGLVVVSGLARGIDAEAHRGALDEGAATIALLGSGLGSVYPPEHEALSEEIAQSGALVTEFPLDSAPRAPHFPLRNRLIAAFSRAVVIVEARERSGTLVTARHAAQQGVDVLALPGPIDAPTSRGPNLLLRDGARPLLEPRDLREVLGLREPAARGSEASLPPRPAGQASLLEALGMRPQTRDDLAHELGRTPAELAVDLLELELEGIVVLDRDGRLRIRAS